MDFFGRQEKARKKTKWLVLFFVLAVVLIIAAVNLAIFFTWTVFGAGGISLQEWLSSPYFFWLSGLTLAVIGFGSLGRIAQLRSGGKAVADMMGARRILPETSDPHERRLINVVEEMAIASGTPVPRLYVMDEEAGINAFVAGWQTQESILVVTRGTLNELNRAELQGVIGHEFSHIFNGDMRLNIRLLGVLTGILLIGQSGQFILRNLHSASWGSSRRSKDGGNIVIFLFVLSVVLIAVGYIGLFFGRLIKAAIARQREFLADAASVQYTRDNTAIGNALAKIKLASGGSLLANAHAEEMSHMCFGQSVKIGFASLLATHPPLDERIRALGLRPEQLVQKLAKAEAEAEAESDKSENGAQIKPATSGAEFLQKATIASTVMASIGALTPLAVAQAHALQRALPADLQQAAHERSQVRELVLAVLLTETSSTDGHALDVQALPVLRQRLTAERLTLVQEFSSLLNTESAHHRLVLLNNARAALELLAQEQKLELVTLLHELSRHDDTITPFEFVVTALVQQWLLPVRKGEAARVRRYADVTAELAIVLNVVVRASGRSTAQMQSEFDLAMASFGLPATAFSAHFDADQLRIALAKLDGLTPLLKRPLLSTLAELVLADNQITAEEAELLRAIAELLNCPMPPLNLPAKN